VEVYQNCVDSCVTILCEVEYSNGFYTQTGESLGSGFIIKGVNGRLFLFSFEHEFITRNETGDGVVIPNALDEKTINSYEKLYEVCPKAGTGISPYCTYDTGTATLNAFAEDKLLMYTATFSDLGAENIRNMASEYMILPMPKYDENQDDYITPFATGVAMALIPTTAVDAENSAKVMEYMGYYGEKNITPVYIEQTLKLKYASDPQVMEMVQYIIDRAAFTLTQALIWNCDAGANFRNMYCFGSLNAVGSPNVASFYSSYRRVWKKQLDTLVEGLQ